MCLGQRGTPDSSSLENDYTYNCLLYTIQSFSEAPNVGRVIDFRFCAASRYYVSITTAGYDTGIILLLYYKILLIPLSVVLTTVYDIAGDGCTAPLSASPPPSCMQTTI